MSPKTKPTSPERDIHSQVFPSASAGRNDPVVINNIIPSRKNANRSLSRLTDRDPILFPANSKKRAVNVHETATAIDIISPKYCINLFLRCKCKNMFRIPVKIPHKQPNQEGRVLRD